MTLATRTFALHGLLVRDKLLMTSMVERAGRRTETLWVQESLERADCVFFQGKLPTNVRAGAECVYVGAGSPTEGTRSLQYPPRVSEFVAVLADIDSRLHAARLSPRPPKVSSNLWRPLVEKLQRSLAEGQEFDLVDAQGSGWTLLPKQRQYAACGEGALPPRDLLDSAPSRWRIVETASTTGYARHALEPLLWFLGLATGPEGVLSSIGMDQPMRMRVWPYLLPQAPRHYSQFATLLRDAPRSAIELQAMSSAPMADAAAFVNACTLCGFLTPVEEAEPIALDEPASATQTTTKQPKHRFTRFLGAIRSALGMPA